MTASSTTTSTTTYNTLTDLDGIDDLMSELTEQKGDMKPTR
jgi:hypothetical protein